MSLERQYASMLVNLARQYPLDLDAQIFDAPQLGQMSAVERSAFTQSSAVWAIPEEKPSCIGLRITAPIEHADFLAARLAAIALERKIYPIFLSYIFESRMQRFGFRVEQLAGLDEPSQKEFEEQLARFWNLAIIIDASEIASLK